MADEPEIFWTAEANRNLDQIILYLKTEWTVKEIQKFIQKLNKAVLLISKRPELFRLTNHKDQLRKCVLSKHTSIFYKETNSKIYIVSLFDNRQDPKKMEH
ncbi:MAG: type II toxin-antitoxin system RelE/ParE family toxin [bacterium]|nr:type II toxin-antitoxin system RelE/ParE family toxin [bacterium]